MGDFKVEDWEGQPGKFQRPILLWGDCYKGSRAGHFLKYCNRIIKGDGCDGFCEVCGTAGTTQMPAIQFINALFGIFNKGAGLAQTAAVFRPVRGVQVFHQIHTMRLDGWKQFLKRYDLFHHVVATIIQHNIKWPGRRDHFAQEFPIRLVSNKNP